MSHLHESLHIDHGVCLWTVLAAIVFVIVLIVFAVHLYRQKRRKDEFEKELNERHGTDISAIEPGNN